MDGISTTGLIVINRLALRGEVVTPAFGISLEDVLVCEQGGVLRRNKATGVYAFEADAPKKLAACSNARIESWINSPRGLAMIKHAPEDTISLHYITQSERAYRRAEQILNSSLYDPLKIIAASRRLDVEGPLLRAIESEALILDTLINKDLAAEIQVKGEGGYVALTKKGLITYVALEQLVNEL